MKSALISTIAFASLTTVVGCGTARAPEVYRDDTKAVLDSKSADIKTCYDGILKSNGTAQGKVTVKFAVETEAGKFQNIVVDKANTTAPPELADCVTKAITGLGIAPPDKHDGDATFVWEFTIGPTPPPAFLVIYLGWDIFRA